jgi:ABC-2 type transport system ATP-binding protein
MTLAETPATAHGPLIAQGVTKIFRERDWLGRLSSNQALSDLDLHLEPGEAFGLIGPNGAGKSTTIKLTLGLAFPTRGTIQLNGLPCTDHRARQGVGYIPENPALYDHLTALETVQSAARMQGMGKDQAATEAERLLNEVGLSERAKSPLRSFSKGMSQRVAVAHALAGNPRVIIADEPLSGLDPVWRKRVVDLFMAFRDAGGTLLLSSHILADVERLADRVGILYGGSLREVTTPAELLAREVTSYIVRSQGAAAPSNGANEGMNQWSQEVAVENLWGVLFELREQGHQLLEIRPSGAGLEGALTQLLNRYEGEDGI